MVRTSVLFRGWMLTVLHQSRQGVNRLMFRMSRCFLAIWVTSAFASSIDAGWFCGDRGGCRVRAASVRCPNNDQSLCQPLFIVDPIRQDVARVVAQPLVSPASPGPLAITLTSSVNVKSIGPSRWPVYELNPNLGRARRSGRGGFSSLPIYPEIATVVPDFGGAIGFGGLSGGGASTSSTGSTASASSVEGGSPIESRSGIGRLVPGSDPSEDLNLAVLLLANTVDPSVDPANLPSGPGLDDPGPLLGPRSTDPASTEWVVPPSPLVASVPEPAAIVSTLTGLVMVLVGLGLRGQWMA